MRVLDRRSKTVESQIPTVYSMKERPRPIDFLVRAFIFGLLTYAVVFPLLASLDLWVYTSVDDAFLEPPCRCTGPPRRPATTPSGRPSPGRARSPPPCAAVGLMAGAGVASVAALAVELVDRVARPARTKPNQVNLKAGLESTDGS